MPAPKPRFTEQNGPFLEYEDSNAVAGQELRIFTIGAANLNYFIDIEAAGLVPKTAQDVTVGQTNSKSGSSSVRRYPGDPNPYSRRNVARTVLKNRSVRHGNALPGKRFTLSEIADDGELRQFTYVGKLPALHSMLVTHGKVDMIFTHNTGAWEVIKPVADGGD